MQYIIIYWSTIWKYTTTLIIERVNLSASAGFYPERDFATPEGSPLRPPSYRLPPDPRAEVAFGARPPPSRTDGARLSLAPLPDGLYQETGEEEHEEDVPSWRRGPPFPPFSGRGGGGRGGAPSRVYESEWSCHFSPVSWCCQFWPWRIGTIGAKL